MREKMEKEIVTLACASFPEEYVFRLETNIAMQEVCVGKNNFYRLFELDEEFHQILFQGTGKLRTWKMLQQLNMPFNRLRLLRLAEDSNLEVIISQHKEILRLVTERKTEQAVLVMEAHLRLVVVEQEMLKAKYPHYFI